MKTFTAHRLLMVGLFAGFVLTAAAAEKAPAGRFANTECVNCHVQREPQLVGAWKTSSHARKRPKADCVTCHGTAHTGSLVRARRDSACSGCHDKLNRAVVHSYAASKHSVIMRLEEAGSDWSQPLARGNYRAPGCAYCHLHAGQHDTRLSVMPWEPFRTDQASVQESVLDRRQSVCGECHAPRYVAEQTATGLDMIGIARMKLREARAIVTRYRDMLGTEEQRALDALFGNMQTHARHVQLGVGHQSPDYQWWHGQPALDGDLLRVKGLIGDHERGRELARESRTGK